MLRRLLHVKPRNDADASPFSGSTRGLPSSGRCLRCRESILDVKFESVQHARNRLQVDPHLLCGSGRGAGGNGAQNLPVGVQSSCAACGSVCRCDVYIKRPSVERIISKTGLPLARANSW